MCRIFTKYLEEYNSLKESHYLQIYLLNEVLILHMRNTFLSLKVLLLRANRSGIIGISVMNEKEINQKLIKQVMTRQRKLEEKNDNCTVNSLINKFIPMWLYIIDDTCLNTES